MQKTLKKLRKKSISMLIIGGILFANGAFVSHQAFADSNENLAEYKSKLERHASSKPMLDFMIKLSNNGALDELEYDSNSKVVGLKHDFATIQSIYQFTDEEMVYFRKLYNLLQKLG
ncbi:hypothetical protein [Bacillus toyonensis]|uniref:Uncharacterized protein n=1 Tax=Bacillus toyonensis TaxID=155322 RepID=A0A2A8H854_9BACI|nr:hypothetical protein [Bacillus toyonensis]PEP90421.1 hypothetical protein CN585_28315 [Bacillus toyonensis]